MKIYVERTKRGLHPISDEDRDALRRVPVGDLLTITHRGRRNGKLFRKFHALVNRIAESTGMPVPDVRIALKIRAGHFDEHVTEFGEIVYIPRSISYDDCDPAEFADFYAKAVVIAGRPPYNVDVEGEGFA